MKIRTLYFLFLAFSLKSFAQMSPLERADSLHEVGKVFQAKESYAKAIAVYLPALKIKQGLLSEYDESIRKTANNLALAYKARGEHWTAIRYRNLAIRCQEATFEQPNRRLALYYNDLGFHYFKLALLDTAFHYFNKSERLYQQIIDGNLRNQIELADVWNNKALYFIETGDLDLAEEHLKKVVPLWEPPRHNRSMAMLNFNFGELYRAKRTLTRSLTHYRLALKASEADLSPAGRIWYSDCLERMAVILNDIGKDEDVIRYIDESIKIKEKYLPGHHPSISSSYQVAGFLLRSQGQFQRAEDYLNTVYEAKLKTSPIDTLGLSVVLGELGRLYEDWGKFVKAEGLFRQSLVLRQAHLLPGAVKTLRIHTELAGILYAQDKFAQSIEESNQALAAFVQRRLEPGADLTSLQGGFPLVNVIATRANARAAFSLQSTNVKMAKEALEDFKLLHRLVRQARAGHDQPEDKLRVLKDLKVINEYAISVSHFLYESSKNEKYLEDAFYFMEQSKSIVLLEDWESQSIIFKNRLDPHIFQRETQIRKKLLAIATARNLGGNASYLEQLQVEYDQKLKDYFSWQDEVKESAPDLFDAIYSSQFTTVQQLKDSFLTADRSVVQYFVGKQNIFILVLNKESTILLHKKGTGNLDDLVERLRYNISAYYDTGRSQRTSSLAVETRDGFLQTSRALYQELIAPIATHLKKKVTIFPDGKLGNIPFEVLLTDTVKEPKYIHSYPYLIRKHQISYAYSGNVLLRSKNYVHQQQPLDESLILAPFSQQGYPFTLTNPEKYPVKVEKLDFTRLPNSIKEGKEVLKSFQGQLLMDSVATTQQFETLSPNYRILHLITHGFISDSNADLSLLAFARSPSVGPSVVFLQNIYDLRLNADLVFLSACQSGSGRVYEGEGVMSLSRAFALAGAKSLISSLWNVPDNQISIKLISDFYAQLKLGKDKEDALHQAKLKLLKNSFGEQALPFFWAPFVAYGDMSPIQ